MVGVAGRSRGCKTCRRRRVKCDEHHPTCNRCEKAGYTCEGYQDRNFIIFDNTIKHENAVQSYKTAAAASTTATAITSDSETTSEVSEIITDFNSLSPVSSRSELTIISEHGSPRTHTPLLLSPTVNRHQLYTGFMYKYFYRGAKTRMNFFMVPGVDLNVDSSLAAMSVGALSTSYFGFKTGTQQVMIDGQKQYGSALSRLNSALSHRSPKDDCDVLAAIVMLCLFEFLMPASITGWIAHALGLGGMFKLLGPEICSQHPYHTYFETCRELIIYAQLTLRLDSFLADKKWLTIPWLTRIEGKTPMEEICDVLTQLCRVQKYFDDALEQRDQEKRNKLIARYQKQLDLAFTELRNWALIHKEACEVERKTITYRAMGTILDDKGNKKPHVSRPALFESIYTYPDLEKANLIAVYHAIYTLLNLFVHNPPPPTYIGLYPDPSPPPPVDSPLYQAFLVSGLEISKSADFHLQEYQDSAGSFHLIFPMRMAARAFEETQMKEEAKWANDVLRSIAMGTNRQWAFAGKLVRENAKDLHEWRK